MNTLEQILTSNNQFSFEYIPTQSSRSKLAKQYINEILFEHPEWKNLLISIVCFPIQKWAKQQREILIKQNGLIEISELGNFTYYGIKINSLTKQKIDDEIDKTNKIIDYIEKILFEEEYHMKNTKVLAAIHDINKPDETIYKVANYYKSSLEYVCCKYNDEFENIIKDYGKEFLSKDAEYEILYHNTEVLLKSKGLIEDLINSPSISEKKADYEKTKEILENCISALKTYITKDRNIYTVIKMKYDGVPDGEIVKAINKSRSYVRSKYKEGIEALSYIMWGYSSRSILNNIL